MNESPSRSRIRLFLEGAAERPVDPVVLAAHWRMARVELRAAGAAAVARNPNAPAKLRGAWGRALAGGPCLWPAPCGYDLFFNVQGAVTARLELPKPFTLLLMAEAGDLVIALTLFGVATDWAGEAADAPVRAARAGLDGATGRRALEIIHRDIAIAGEAPLADLSAGAVLRFLSPVSLRQGGAHHAEPASMITSLANRIGGLARWQGLRLALNGAALKAEATRLGAAAEWV
ncbi:MAG: hypothetical protein ACK5MQ_12130, partial [Pikeienuella sp.]